MWQDGSQRAPRNGVPILFVHEDKDPAGWAKLEKFWTRTTGPYDVAAVLGMGIGLTPFPVPRPNVIAPDPEIIKVKVPRGLDDPTTFLPAYNPPTFAKWDLGRQLFFDKTWLSAKGNVSCAGCHIPEQGFTDGLNHDGFNTPTLVNVVYNTAFFWDGRASCLEEVFARSLEDERETERPGPFRHAWVGSVGRLLDPKGEFAGRFEQVFGTRPTQDAVGKALATYMRTLLAGDSVHERALQEKASRKGEELAGADYAKVLDAAALKTLGREGQSADTVAGEMVDGYRLFHNFKKDRPLNCVNCHGGRQFSDGRFHNVGVGDQEKVSEPPYGGRFAHVPLGQKDLRLIGAYRTPTLRGLLRTAPYFHDGRQPNLAETLRFHTQTFHWSPSLAPEMLTEGERAQRRLDLTESESKALLAFLAALNGEAVDAAVLPRLP
jgi:cytochrome c peroxidase